MLYLIALTQGQYAIVDEDTYDDVGRFKWRARRSRTSGYYAQRWVKTADGKKVLQQMHRHILGLPPGRVPQTDHLNRNTLDNRRSNLKAKTCRGNQENRKDQSKYGPGVSLDKRRVHQARPFSAFAWIGYTRHYIGTFGTAGEAQEARSNWLREIGVAS